jgi:hypothetical protein
LNFWKCYNAAEEKQKEDTKYTDPVKMQTETKKKTKKKNRSQEGKERSNRWNSRTNS